jgi:hypothetical protein
LGQIKARGGPAILSWRPPEKGERITMVHRTPKGGQARIPK